MTTGSQQLLYLVAEALINRGDIVITEAPSYFVFLDQLKARGAEVIGIPIDEQGMRVDLLESCLERLSSEGHLPRVKLIYSVTEHSNPSGLSLSPERRKTVVALARQFSHDHKIYVLDDAAYRGLGFDNSEPESLWSQDRSGDWVIHARTFSKTFSPGMKLGYGILPEDLLSTVLALKGHHDFGSSNLMQRLMLQVLESGQYVQQVQRLQSIYKTKSQATLETLEEHLSEFKPEVRWTEPKGGLYIWLTLPQEISTGRDSEFFEACLTAGVFYVPGEFCFPSEVEGGQISRNQIRLCYGVPTEATIREGVRRLASVVRQFMNASIKSS
jgi:2-aminoadipate transaminase